MHQTVAVITTMLFAVLFMTSATNAKPSTGISLNLHEYGSKDINSSGYNIVQDHRGFYWFAGFQGLQRWDGQSLESLFPGKLGLLPREHIQVMAVSTSHLWLGTRGGLVSMDLDTYSTQFYINTWPGGLSHLNIRAIKVDRFERVWVSTSNGLNLYRPQSRDFIRYNVPLQAGKSGKNSLFDSVAAFDQGSQWVVSRRQGLLRLDLTSGQFTPVLELLKSSIEDEDKIHFSSKKARKVLHTRRGTMVLLSNRILFEFDGYKLINRFELPSAGVDDDKSSYVQSVVEDRFENIWILLKSNRLVKLDSDRAGIYRSQPMLSNGVEIDPPNTMTTDNQGQLLFGFTETRPKIWNPLQQQVSWKGVPQLAAVSALSSGSSSNGNIWFNSNRSVFRYDDKTQAVEGFPFDPQKPSVLLTPVELGDGRVFVGGYYGLFEIDTKTGKYSNHFGGAVFSLRHSERWGLWYRDHYNFYHYDPSTKIKKTYKLSGFDAIQASKPYIDERYGPMFVYQNSLYHYLQAEDKFIKVDFINDSFMEMDSYLLTVGDDLYLAGRGLNRAKLSYSPSGLNLTNSRAIREFGNDLLGFPMVDDNGKIWLTGQSWDSFYRFDPENSNLFKTSVESGFPSKNLGAALSFDKKGNLISFLNGKIWSLATPGKNLNSPSKRLAISMVKVISNKQKTNKIFSLNNTVEVTHQDLGVQFGFTDNLGGEADYSRLQFRLQGYEQDWLPAQNFEVLYTSLNPGSYRFEIKTSDGQFESLDLEVMPAPWRTWWAYSLYTVFLLFLAWLYFKQQLRNYLESRQREDQIRLYAESFESASEGFCVCSKKAKLLACNPAFQALIGVDSSAPLDVTSKVSLLRFIDREQSSRQLVDMQKTLEAGGSWSGQLWLQSKHGKITPINCKGKRVEQKAKHDELYMLVCSDISEQIHKEQELERLASVDPLTGLPNRRLLNDRINRLISTSKRKKEKNSFALLLINIDRFKSINDSLGHDLGDETLIQVGRRLRQCLREIDTVARLSGDEFSVVLEDVENIEDVAKVCQKLSLENESPIFLQQREVHVSFSVGIVIFPSDGNDLPSLMKNADSAINTVKQRGGNSFAFYTQRMNEKSLNALKLEAEIRQGLKKQEFLVHLQPKIDMVKGNIVGAEALVRWKKPQQGLIPPGLFIEAAEHTGLIIPLGLLVIREACKYLHHWRNMNYAEIPLAVNISAKQLLLENFVDIVDAAVLEFGIKPSLLEFEITESTVMRDMDSAIEKLHQLRQRGHRISVDDFGTGYSSLSYISTLPIDVLKVDQSFVRDMLEDKNKFNIVKTIVELAQNLGLKTVAEGIETEEIHLALLKLGVDFGQGYFYGRPQGIDALEQSDLFINANAKSHKPITVENQ